MTRYLGAEVCDAFNRAADEVLNAIDAPDEGARDAINLVVNAGLHFLRDANATLADAIAANYHVNPGDDGPLAWAREGANP